MASPPRQTQPLHTRLVADDTLVPDLPSTDATLFATTGEEDGGPLAIRTTMPGPTSADRYSLCRTLGTGGMGAVLLVRDEIIGREVALKQIQPSMQGKDHLRVAFEREARLHGQLEHPAIVPVYDVGAHRDGSLFFTMRRVKGDSLGEILDALRGGAPDTRLRYTRRRLLSALSQICLAAHYAHVRGVVHRDIKPANIMLGSFGEVYLLDWGVAKVSSPPHAAMPSPEDLELFRSRGDTVVGTIVGTPQTMAPEQVMGREVDARTDVYALGAVLFESLTGEPLHGDGDVRAILDRIVAGVDARPSVRTPDVDVPPELERICVKATRRVAGERFQTARELHEALEAYLDGDRDLALRREGSRAHAAQAKVDADAALAAKVAAEGEEGERGRRVRALREVGRALALDPENVEALRTLVGLLTNPPRRVPPEVRREQEAVWRKHLRGAGIAAAAIYSYISANALFTRQLGVHDWSSFYTAHALWAGALVASLACSVWPSYAALFVAYLFGVAASVWNTGVYGPHLMVPTFLTMHATLYSLVRYGWLRATIVGVAVAAWTLSIFGAMGGLFPRIVRFVDGGIFIKSPVLDFPETLTTVYLYAAVLAMVVLPSLVIGYLRRSYHRADEELRLRGWQLRQLVGEREGAKGAAQA